MTEGFAYALHTVNGQCYLLGNGPDMISRHLRNGHVWEDETLKLAQHLLRGIERPVVVDVGANLGAFTVPMGLHVAPMQGCVFSFEAQRQVYYQLCANLLINGLIDCHAFNQAVGAVDGQIEVPVLDLSKERNAGALTLNEEVREMITNLQKRQPGRGVNTLTDRVEKVALKRLDDLGLPPAHLLKIDVEGMELDVLRGGSKWLQNSGNPPILLEVWQTDIYAVQRENLLAYVRTELGYEDLFIRGELCLAQHPENRRLRFDPLPQGGIKIVHLAHQ